MRKLVLLMAFVGFIETVSACHRPPTEPPPPPALVFCDSIPAGSNTACVWYDPPPPPHP